MRVLVCGSREQRDKAYVERWLSIIDAERGISVLIEGGAPGVDTLACTWAIDRNIKVETYTADWHQHGRSAGPRRNALMLENGKPELVVAFPGGRGTADMVERARTAGVEIVEISVRG